MTSTIAQYDTTTLAAQVVGPVLTPGAPGYDDEVAGFNVAHRPAPAVVIGATSAADISATVRWATEQGLQVRSQATGHGLTNDLAGTVLISTRRLIQLDIDPVAGTARIGAGVRWRAVIDAAAPRGLAPLNGSSSNVGVVGYTLGGGIGPMARRYGFAADHVLALTLVTADGEIRAVNADQHPDLFWALRGGKIGFGVVTEIEIELMPVSRFFGGGIFFPGTSAADVLYAWRLWAPTLPVEASTSVALLRLPPDPQLPPPLQGQFVVHLRYTHLGDADEASARLAPMRGSAPIMIDTVAELPYAAIDAVHMDPTSPMPSFDRGMALREFPAEAVDQLVATNGADSGSALTLTEVRLLGGALAAPSFAPNAVAGRQAAFAVYVLGVPAGPVAAQIPGQAGAVIDALRPWRDGGLLNFLGHAEPTELTALWSTGDRQQLAHIAQRYDPSDTFGGAAVFDPAAR
jgi:hypothetical protein